MKIISSIGPNCKDNVMLKAIVDGGSDILRFNMSHADCEDIESKMSYIRKNYPKVQIAVDLKGNKIRVDKSYVSQRMIRNGEIVKFCSAQYYINASDKHNLIPLDFQGGFSKLYGVREILMKDGTMKFKVIGVNGNSEPIKAKTLLGGIVRAGKGVNAINMDREHQHLTTDDKDNIQWAVTHKADIIIFSYISSTEEIKEAKGYISHIRKSEAIDYKPRLWAKIECREGIENIEKIAKSCDGIVIGRGDMSCEITPIAVPIVEDLIMDSVKRMKKEIVIATSVLESMKYEKEPRLSEYEAIYRLVKKGATSFMLCSETNIGKYPVKAVENLKGILNMYSDNTL